MNSKDWKTFSKMIHNISCRCFRRIIRMKIAFKSGLIIWMNQKSFRPHNSALFVTLETWVSLSWTCFWRMWQEEVNLWNDERCLNMLELPGENIATSASCCIRNIRTSFSIEKVSGISFLYSALKFGLLLKDFSLPRFRHHFHFRQTCFVDFQLYQEPEAKMSFVNLLDMNFTYLWLKANLQTPRENFWNGGVGVVELQQAIKPSSPIHSGKSSVLFFLFCAPDKQSK